MNGIRIDLFLGGEEAPAASFPCAVRQPGKAALTLVGTDSPLLRAKLVEFLLANPGADLVASPCFVGRTADFRDAHELVRRAFGGAGPAPISFNVKEAARRMGVSYTHMRKLVRLGAIRKAHGRIASAELERYLKQKTQAARLTGPP